MPGSPETPAPPRRRTTIKKEMAEAIAAVLAKARRALFITGAGLSADSGLPTYRGIGGLYDQADPDEGLPIETLLSGEMMRRKPEVTWKYVHQIELACRGAEPNRGHQILAELEHKLERVVIFTQNVDGFHRAAGSQHVIEIHGNLHDLRCTKCAWRTHVDDFSRLALPPRCPTCKAIVRPDVVLFGEALPAGPFNRFEEELARGFDVVFSIGTSALFPYIARPVLVAKSEGIPTIEINPGKTDLSDVVDYRIKATALTALKAIWAAYRALMPRRTQIGR
jgi:NAD-dependent protein deacetylase/lipoamidase